MFTSGWETDLQVDLSSSTEPSLSEIPSYSSFERKKGSDHFVCILKIILTKLEAGMPSLVLVLNWTSLWNSSPVTTVQESWFLNGGWHWWMGFPGLPGRSGLLRWAVPAKPGWAWPLVALPLNSYVASVCFCPFLSATEVIGLHYLGGYLRLKMTLWVRCSKAARMCHLDPAAFSVFSLHVCRPAPAARVVCTHRALVTWKGLVLNFWHPVRILAFLDSFSSPFKKGLSKSGRNSTSLFHFSTSLDSDTAGEWEGAVIWVNTTLLTGLRLETHDLC